MEVLLTNKKGSEWFVVPVDTEELYSILGDDDVCSYAVEGIRIGTLGVEIVDIMNEEGFEGDYCDARIEDIAEAFEI